MDQSDPECRLVARAPRPAWGRGDVICLLALAAAIAWLDLAALRREGATPGNALAALFGDFVLAFLPWFEFLGESLRSWNIPAWNPHQFAGSPFVANPQSGWMALLVMAPFTFLPLAGAAAATVVLHQLVLALSTYGLGRVLGLNPAGALAAAVSYAFSSGWAVSFCCPQFHASLAWLPLMLLGAEQGLRQRDALSRAGWLLVAGFATSQSVASWLGQGSYYSLLLLAGWIGFRALIWPVAADRRWPGRVTDAVAAGGLILACGLAMNAAALLPRLEFNPATNVAGGEYLGPEAALVEDEGALPLEFAPAVFLSGHSGRVSTYAGLSVAMLALLCPFVAPRWRPCWFLLAAAMAVLLLATPSPAPLEPIFNLFPGFEALHAHYRFRITNLIGLPLALLAGAAVTSVTAGGGGPPLFARGAAAGLTGCVLAAAVVIGSPRLFGATAPAAAAGLAAIALAALGILGGGRAAAPVAAAIGAALSAVLLWDLAAREVLSVPAPAGSPYADDFAALTGAEGAGAFVASAGEPARYFGFSPALLGDIGDQRRGYAGMDREATARRFLFGGNQATALGIDDLQGYDPVHPLRYMETIRSMNGGPQLYRFLNLYPDALGSPLLDLLNVRFAIVPAGGAQPHAALDELAATWPEVWAGDGVRVLENREAAPRAWLASEARVAGYGEALALLESRAVDGRRVALVEDPAFAMPPGAWEAPAVPLAIERPDSDRIEVSLPGPAPAPAMLIVSEVYDKGWRASVDGSPAEAAVVHHTLIGVPVPAGAREIVLEYDPPSLKLGLAVSASAFAGAGAVWAVNGARLARNRRRGRT